ncbi:tyrosine-type recombinase/integrase [Agathobaculum sp. Marseille-P7918]|uniref:tyrosine-type recombinase/integrase n=1 Tax=Agathobaculum sp. Marseille-P7918 TaxID=2479843 RepID=UPI000F63C049|nr:tyrosine-type recombinase/integrase [Agathobaculum sp. Marseille-P7918]
MDGHQLTARLVAAYEQHLRAEERSAGTIEKYLRDVRAFQLWLGRGRVDNIKLVEWKSYLMLRRYAPVTINSMLAAVNSLCRFLGWNDCHVKYLKVQRRLFRESARELTKAEYARLLAAAQALRQQRLALLMETICSTGIRVSEVKYITVEAARRGRAEIALKGKIRTILLPKKLARKLLQYAEQQKTASGEIFLTASGKSLSRRQIWAEMKHLCSYARVEPTKVFPHNLRHLFATAFYQVCKDIVHLADVLGHSSIETTRIYLVTSGKEHARQLEKLGLVS